MMRSGIRELRLAAKACLEERDLEAKVASTLALRERWLGGAMDLDTSGEAPGPALEAPGLPSRLVLVPPTRVERRGFGSPRRLAAFVHSIAHIEWNAINLAWDAVWRFGGMPREYYDDWSRVAAEEAHHFSLLRGRLVALGADYGDMPAHAGLWETAEATAHDLLARMALVPRVLEARGLDVTPPMILRLREGGQEETAAILEVILADEIGHVRVGSRWFHHLCRERGLEPASAFAGAVKRLFRGRSRVPADPGARRLRLAAGFREDELEALARLADDGAGKDGADRDQPPGPPGEGNW